VKVGPAAGVALPEQIPNVVPANLLQQHYVRIRRDQRRQAPLGAPAAGALDVPARDAHQRTYRNCRRLRLDKPARRPRHRISSLRRRVRFGFRHCFQAATASAVQSYSRLWLVSLQVQEQLEGGGVSPAGRSARRDGRRRKRERPRRASAVHQGAAVWTRSTPPIRAFRRTAAPAGTRRRRRSYPGFVGCHRTFCPRIGFHIATQPAAIFAPHLGQSTFLMEGG